MLAATLLAAAVLTLVTSLAGARPTGDNSCPWVGQKASPARRAHEVLRHMTLDDKIALVHGAGGSAYVGHIPANERLCIPALNLEDGPAGVADGMTGVTQLPAPVAVAASWDPKLAAGYGEVIGSEEAGKGANVNLGPTINIVRDPRWGRAFESFSEDPYLTGELAASEIRAVQHQGVISQVKHYAVYNQETYRNTPQDDAIVSRRAMHEIYLPAFQQAIDEGHVGSIMCSYSTVNGEYACQNRYLLKKVLRNEWGFKGFVTSDWGATHSTVPSARAGLDMEMPDGTYYGSALEQAVEEGQVSEKTLDRMVLHILTQMFRFGLFDHPARGNPDATVTSPAHAKVAREVAEQGSVLLKNEGGLLPLDASRVHSIAVIGPGGGSQAMTSGGGSAQVQAPYVITPYQGISERAGSGVKVRYAEGLYPQGQLPAVPASAFGSGLEVTYYGGTDLSGNPIATGEASNIDYNWKGSSPTSGVPATDWSASWSGTLIPPKTGTYTFSLTSDDGSRLYIDGKELINNWGDHAATTKTARIQLTAGQQVNIRVEYYQAGGDSSLSLGWQVPGSTSPKQQAVELAKKSDVAVVFADKYESEGSDLQDISLGSDQNRLISAIAKANPNTIVVLNTGSAVTMPWIDRVKGVLEAWYPGQEDGNAIAALLFGDVNPSGKLPVTFPKNLAQVPAHTPARWPGVDGKVHYSEGLDVGYRWYDEKNLEPLFPFGYGLSYTTFRLSHLTVTPEKVHTGHKVRIRVRVTNTGSRPGDEVVQVYVADPQRTGEPPRQLRAFEKIHLRPGQSKRVSMSLTRRAFAVWDGSTQTWKVPDGAYRILVGDSSRNLPLEASIQVEGQ